MKETFILRVPDRSGILLELSQLVLSHQGNIVRLNYNKGVDERTLFMEVDCSQDGLLSIREYFQQLGYLQLQEAEDQVVLCLITLPDQKGALVPILELINQHQVYISFVNYRRKKKERQQVKIGLRIQGEHTLEKLVGEIGKLCPIQVENYEVTNRSLDNSLFYGTFANEMKSLLGLSHEETYQVLVQSNHICQMLDEGNESHLKTFDYIRRFAKFIQDHKGEKFIPFINRYPLAQDLTLFAIEPPCGSNTYCLEYQEELLFVDSGFGCYTGEMHQILERLFPDFDHRPKRIAITHSDPDHVGLLDWFDTVYMAQTCYDNFRDEQNHRHCLRERNSMHKPYIRLAKIITGYKSPSLENVQILGSKKDHKILSRIGSFSFGPFEWQVYQGMGGHVPGESVLVCPELETVFTGDIYVNIKGFSDSQREFNILAPYLMTSVDEDSALARQTRNLLVERYQGYTILPGHGAILPSSRLKKAMEEEG